MTEANGLRKELQLLVTAYMIELSGVFLNRSNRTDGNAAMARPAVLHAGGADLKGEIG